jgi:hypothetical protein
MLPARTFNETRRFALDRRLGEGAMGEVFAAFDRERGARVALKRLRSPSPDGIARFKREFRILQDLHHPNLVTLGELFVEEGEWFFTMELVQGVHLFEWVDASRPGSEARLRQALSGLASGLHALHRAGKVHRDVKPSNVMITAEGRVVILDFGLTTDSGAHGSELAGTASFMAPEQAAREPAGPAADWYAVGVILYRALTGRLPFVGTAAEIMHQKLTRRPSPVRTLCPTVPSDLELLCDALLQPAPEHRPTDIEILVILGAHDPSAGASLPRVFVGRAEELDVLAHALEAARNGPVTVLVHGESGIGKSALVEQFVQSLPEALVFCGRCCQRESVPFKGLDELIDGMVGWLSCLPRSEARALLPQNIGALVQIFPALQELAANLPQRSILDPRELRRVAFDALQELVAALARSHSVILTLDDLQWADADCLAMLAGVLQAPEPPPLLLLATVQLDPGEPPGPLERLVQCFPGPVHRLPLVGLRPEKSELLASLLLEHTRPSGPASAHIAHASGGHPLFIGALVERLRDQHGQSTPIAIEDALLGRIEALNPQAHHLVELVALAVEPLPQVVAAALSGVELMALPRLAIPLVSARLVRLHGTETVDIFHHRVRQVVLQAMSEPRGRELHGQLAQALEGRAEPEVLARHYRGAGDEVQAARFAELAGDRAVAALAFHQAAVLYRQALSVSTEPSLQRKLADALANAGRGKEAADAYRAAGTELELRRRAAEQLLRSGHMEEGLLVMRELLQGVGLRIPPTPWHAIASVLWRRARLWLRGFAFRERSVAEIPAELLARVDVAWAASQGLALTDPIRGQALQAIATLWSLEAGEPGRLVQVLAAEAAYRSVSGGRQRAAAEALLETAASLAERMNSPRGRGIVQIARGMAHYQAGRWRAARTELRSGERTLREQVVGATWDLDTGQMFLLESLLYLGAVGELATELPPRLIDAEARGDRFGATALRSAAANLVWLAKDEPGKARAECELALRCWPQDRFYIQHFYALRSQVDADLYAGEDSIAHVRVEERWKALRSSLMLRFEGGNVRARHLRARAALAGGGPTKLIEDCVAHLERTPLAWSVALAALVRSGLAARSGRPDSALSWLQKAITGLESADMDLFAAAARWRWGALQGGEDGALALSRSDAWMRGQGILHPERFVALLAPGFPEGR